jgi:hypothetical protein
MIDSLTRCDILRLADELLSNFKVLRFFPHRISLPASSFFMEMRLFYFWKIKLGACDCRLEMAATDAIDADDWLASILFFFWLP